MSRVGRMARSWRPWTRACAVCCVTPLAQDPQLFRVEREAEAVTVSADQVAVDAERALLELGHALGWRVEFATARLREDLSRVSLDLSFDRRDAKLTAQLLATAGGADAVLDERPSSAGATTVVHVVSPPSPDSESGRQRLRQRALGWYTAFLADDLQLEPLVNTKRIDVRMHVGHLLLADGALEPAIEQFTKIRAEDGAHPYVPLALLRMAQSYHELGKFEEAEKWASEVSRMHPSRPETAAATVLLGRNLLAQHRYDECVARMRAAVLPLASTPEIVDVLLITAEAHRHRERPDYVIDQLKTLSSSSSFRDLSEAQWLDYHFLRGYGAEGLQQWSEATEALEIFLGTGSGDPRRAEALVMLGRCYFATDKFVEARAAAQQALINQDRLEPSWRKEARILQARSGLVLGLADQAFEELEREVRRDPLESPELIAFLADQFLEAGRLQKAIVTADLLATRPGRWGDQGRYLKILALWQQKPDAAHLPAFIAQARELGMHIEDPELQRKTVELIGRAHAALGNWDSALEAYHGVLR